MEKNIDGLMKATAERTPEEWRENAKKGGKASGEARRKKADLRAALQTALTGTYKTADGKTMTGAEMIILSLVKIASDPAQRGAAVQAFNTIIKMLGQDAPEHDENDNDMVRQFLDAIRG